MLRQVTERTMRQRRKGPFKGKGADSRAARREAPVGVAAAPVLHRGRAGNPAASVRSVEASAATGCGSGGRSRVQGWTLIGSIAIQTSNLPLAIEAADRVQRIVEAEGRCRIGSVGLRWMRLQQFYRYIGALP